VASQLPPASAARSTTTEPCFIAATILGQFDQQQEAALRSPLTWFVINFGAGFPGIKAYRCFVGYLKGNKSGIRTVVIMISTSLACSKNSAISASINFFDITWPWCQHNGRVETIGGGIALAYPPAPSPSSLISTSKNSAPRDSTCSRAADRVSKPLTIAPILLACDVDSSKRTVDERTNNLQ